MYYSKNNKKITKDDIFSLSDDHRIRFSKYHITHEDIMNYYNVSYSLSTKMMSKLVNNSYEYERRGTSNEAHFVLPDDIELYEQNDKKKWQEQRHYKIHSRKLADIRGWTTPPLIDKLQLKLVFSSYSISRNIFSRFENTEYRKHSSVVIPLDEGVDQYKFIIYPNFINIYIEFFNGLDLNIEKLKTVFDILRRKILNLYGKVAFTLHIPFSFIVTQIYIVYRSFNKKPCPRKPFNKNISLTLSEIIPFINAQ